MLTVPGLPFPLRPTDPGVWRLDERGAVVGAAPAHTDLYVDPSGADLAGTGTTATAPALLGSPPDGDYQLSARVTVDFRSTYDAGVLLLHAGERTWAKLCLELSPAGAPMVVSVVTRDISDDANAFVVDGPSVGLRVSRIGRVHAFHASTDGRTWQLVRVFGLGDVAPEVGFEAQSPTGDGCTATFDEVRFVPSTLTDPRDGT